MLATKTSFLDEYPHLEREWHPTKNQHLNPYSITSGSDIRAWWMCHHGHEWDTRISKRTKKNQGCPVCINKKLHISNCLATIKPDLANEWNREKNHPLTPFDVIYVQNIKVWWKCEHGHEWEASVSHRSKNGSGCHYCSKQRTMKKDSIAFLRPDLMKEWNDEKNDTINPEEIALNSTKIVWWKCHHGHEWKKKVTLRTNELELFCPMCKSLEFQRPDLVKEWSDKNTFSPSEVYPNSHKTALWNCKHGHEWKERIDFRTSKENANCPICSSISCTHPYLLKEWDDTKNKLVDPSNITQGSNQKVWWLCEFGHSWKASVTHRAQRNQGCPHCNHSQTSFPEQYIAYALSTVFDKVENRIKINNAEADIFIPSLNIAIEYDGVKWHSDKEEKDKIKNNEFQKNGITMIRVREDGLEPLPGVKNFFITKYPNELQLSHICHELVTYISDFTHKSLVFDSNNVSTIDVLEYISFKKKENSLEQTHPEIVSEWDFEKNGTLKPIHFTHGSGQKVWWKCEKGHSWSKQISKRSAGENCPYCSGRRADEENNLAVQFPMIAKEWNVNKNGSSIPNQFTPKSSRKVWWKCQKGHEWEAVVSSRTLLNNGCPYCSGYKASEEYNLAVINPALANEWHPTKNDGLHPHECTPGTVKKVWWMCKKGHEWSASISGRNSDGRGCPYCSGRKPTKEKTLAFANPSLAKEWHRTKNQPLSPKDVACHSNKKVWWTCSIGHEWEATISNRSYGRGCPECYHNNRKK